MRHHYRNDRWGLGMKLGSIYRDSKRGIVAGVCAGLADYIGISVGLMRLLYLLSFVFFPFPIIIYVVLLFVLPDRNQKSFFFSSTIREEVPSLTELKYRMKRMETRLKDMESYVTSDVYELNRKYKDI